ncbi:MAG: NAD(P)-dependent oxidoreductase [Betaproteobacteria bacterium]|nr:NAD(P)-dependent oxidoreductase [Betaproteobacteria bacterium]MDH4292679.1 NAD(P)-dependent oxidoreductase [Betaproteobacteria bacterium]MDH5342624.1 NAD(P)-dependent oxidoreductase [Betaproteobacteria bacterium]
MTIIRKIGFIGVGNMGNPMAANLLKGGFDITVFDARPETAAAFVAQHGGKAAATLAEVARDADAIVTMLPDDKIVRKVMLDAGGAASALARGTVLIDMGTCDPTGTRGTAEALEKLGIAMVDAPVMGGVVFAKDATLDIMAGGSVELVARSTPVLKAMGRAITHCGPVGSAHAMKALANYINACALINAIEALTIGKKFGLDAKMMADALVPMCAGRNHPIEKKVIPQILTRKYGTGMALSFIAKDVRIAVDTAHALGAAVPLGEKVSELWDAAVKEVGAGVDQTEIVRYWEEATGVRL